ncbi:hypothetical protein YERSI8AC_10080 [Enterobacterales bacterium 8AC]|nr:hypothetical protein YERSI8AC_10080 [Enterobacterales bacterium 8AC]
MGQCLGYNTTDITPCFLNVTNHVYAISLYRDIAFLFATICPEQPHSLTKTIYIPEISVPYRWS